MSLLSHQAKRFVGEFCVKVTKYERKYYVHFRIPNDNKKTITRLIGKTIHMHRGESSTSGFVHVKDDPSIIFNMKSEEPKASEVSRIKEAAPKKKSVKPVVKGAEQGDTKGAKVKIDKESIDKKKLEKPKKRGFFSFKKDKE